MEDSPEADRSPAREFGGGIVYALGIYLTGVLYLVVAATFLAIFPLFLSRAVAGVLALVLTQSGWIQILFLGPCAWAMRKEQANRAKGILAVSAILLLLTSWCNVILLNGS